MSFEYYHKMFFFLIFQYTYYFIILILDKGKVLNFDNPEILSREFRPRFEALGLNSKYNNEKPRRYLNAQNLKKEMKRFFFRN